MLKLLISFKDLVILKTICFSFIKFIKHCFIIRWVNFDFMHFIDFIDFMVNFDFDSNSLIFKLVVALIKFLV